MAFDLDNMQSMTEEESCALYYIMTHIIIFLIGGLIVGMFYWVNKPMHIATTGILLSALIGSLIYFKNKFFDYWKRSLKKNVR